MKRILAGTVIAALVVTTGGCQLLKGKKDDDKQQTQQQPHAAAMDPASMIQATAQVPVSPDMKVGWAVTQQTSASGQKSVTHYAIVGDAGDSWHMEYISPAMAFYKANIPDIDQYVIGLTVDKKTGKVTHAVLGKKGEKGKPIKIAATGAIPTQPAMPAGEDTSVSIGIGTFKAKKVVASGITSYVGTKGDMKMVLLKSEGGPSGSYELKAKPAMKTVSAGGTQVKVKELSYTNGTVFWLTQNPVVAAFFPYMKDMGRFKMATPKMSMVVTQVATDAKPTLAW